MGTDPLISLGVLCDDEFTTTIYQQEITVKNKWTTNNKIYQEGKNRNAGSYPGDTTIKNCGK